MTGCGGNRQVGNNDFITVDVAKKYPKKELILQNFMDVEYIPLETNNEFLCQGRVLAIGKQIIIVKNNVNDGDIFFFDRKGKGLKKINRMGRSGEDYSFISGIILDEDNNELFVNDHSTQRILVYDMNGKFIRSFRHKEGAMFDPVFNYDRNNLICYDFNYYEEGNRQTIMVISKKDGSITKEIHIPYKEKKSTILIVSANDMFYASEPSTFHPIIPYQDNWVLTESSSDTVYRLLPDYSITPFLARTPSIQSMNPEIFLFPGIFTDRYYFMQVSKKEYDFATDKGFPGIDLMYDKQEKTIFECVVYNDDYSNKRPISMMLKTINTEIAFWQKIEADDLVESYEKGILKGRLKEIAAKLEEESNPVIMLAKYKK